jgi:hypothetical protein
MVARFAGSGPPFRVVHLPARRAGSGLASEPIVDGLERLRIQSHPAVPPGRLIGILTTVIPGLHVVHSERKFQSHPAVPPGRLIGILTTVIP